MIRFSRYPLRYIGDVLAERVRDWGCPIPFEFYQQLSENGYIADPSQMQQLLSRLVTVRCANPQLVRALRELHAAVILLRIMIDAWDMVLRTGPTRRVSVGTGEIIVPAHPDIGTVIPLVMRVLTAKYSLVGGQCNREVSEIDASVVRMLADVDRRCYEYTQLGLRITDLVLGYDAPSSCKMTISVSDGTVDVVGIVE